MRAIALPVVDLSAARRDLSVGTVPTYREFVSAVWRWREDGRPCVDAPPWMFTLFIQEPVEVSVVSAVLGSLLRSMPGFADRFEVLALEDGSEFSFADLEALHAFLGALAAIGLGNDTARRVTEYTLWSLGFRWV